MGGTLEKAAMSLLIKRSVAFADWAAGEGICPAHYGDPDADSRNPDQFLLEYSLATGDEDWDTLADRAAEFVAAKDDEIARLREALEFYSNTETYKPHPHGPAFDRRDVSFHARAALAGGSSDA